MNNPVVFWELASHNAKKSVEFLKQVFDWDVNYDPDSGIHYIPVDDPQPKISGGVFTLRKAKLPFLTIYIKVEDIEAKAIEVEKAGGYVIEPPHSLPGGTKICLFNEPSGVTLAMLELPLG